MSDFSSQALFCSLCGLSVAPADYEQHLRSDHGLVSYRGVRRELPEALEVMRFDLFGNPPSGEAWSALTRLAREEHGQGGTDWLAGWLATNLGRVPEGKRKALLAALAELIGTGNEAMVRALAARPEPIPRALALACLVRFPVPVPEGLLKALRGLMYDRTLPEKAQERIAATHLRVPVAEELAGRMLRWLTGKLGRAEALRRLSRVRKLVGEHRLIDEAVSKRTKKARLECPRCRVSLRRAEMEQHLWAEHRLLLEGLRVVDPWDVIEGWAKQYQQTREPEYLERCRVAAARVSPESGAERLNRLLLAVGVADAGQRAALLAKAREQHAAACPWCYALVPVTVEMQPTEVNLRPGRLSAGEYEAEVSERGLYTWLRIAGPRGVVFQGREPGQTFTPGGAATAFAGPLAGLALLLALIWPTAWLGPSLPTVLFLVSLAVLVAIFAWLIARFEKPSEERLLGYAWTKLVPTLNAPGAGLADSGFVAGLARLTSRLEKADVSLELLNAQLQALSTANAPPAHLAAVCRLIAEVSAARGDDPVRLVERWVARCFEGKWTLSFAQHLLENWSASWWSAGHLARLRARLCDRAFEAGFEVQGLLDAGNNAPALGAVLNIDGERGLAGLRLMWSLRAARPWDRLGAAHSVFELAADPARVGLFEKHPDVLLWQEDRGSVIAGEDEASDLRAAEMLLTVDGLWVQEELFRLPPRVFEVRSRPVGWELRLDDRPFRSPNDLEGLARLLEKWFRYAFHEFLPGVDAARRWVSPERNALLRAWGAVPCPECAHFLLPKVGAVGLALEERQA
jgi:hypothetical protein